MKAFALFGSMRTLWRPLSSVTRLGLTLAGAGVVADTIHHAVTHDLHSTDILHIDVIGHVLTLAGMVLAMGGVIQAAVESRRRTRQEGETHAARSGSAAAR